MVRLQSGPWMSLMGFLQLLLVTIPSSTDANQEVVPTEVGFRHYLCGYRTAPTTYGPWNISLLFSAHHPNVCTASTSPFQIQFVNPTTLRLRFVRTIKIRPEIEIAHSWDDVLCIIVGTSAHPRPFAWVGVGRLGAGTDLVCHGMEVTMKYSTLIVS